MLITDYASLQTELLYSMNRVGDTAFPAARYIQTCEAAMKRKIRPFEWRARFTASATSNYVALPLSFGGFERLSITDDTNSILTLTDPSEEPVQNTGRPKKFAYVGTELQLFPEPDQTYALEGIYWVKPTDLSDSNTSNWILDNHPDAYLFGSLAAANEDYKDYTAADRNRAYFEAVLAEIAAQSVRDAMQGGMVLASMARVFGRPAWDIVTG